MIKEVIFLIVGVLGLWGSAELLIYAAQIISKKLNISQTFIGLTVLSIGTTLPELGAHIASSIDILKGINLSDVAIGTNVGSNIIQITMILGIIALLMVVKSSKTFMRKDYVIMLGAIVLLFLLSLDGNLSRLEGFILAALYLGYLYKLGQREHFVDKVDNNYKPKKLWLYTLMIPVGIALLLFFAQLAVKNAHFTAMEMGVSDSLIGALVLGVGTALPELAAALVALKNRASGMSMGVLVGSNITNPLFGVGIGALISGYTVGSRILFFDIPVWFIVSLVAFAMFRTRMKIDKKEGIALILLYIVYAYIRIVYIK
jgi:cation:H+ antiporter